MQRQAVRGKLKVENQFKYGFCPNLILEGRLENAKTQMISHHAAQNSELTVYLEERFER